MILLYKIKRIWMHYLIMIFITDEFAQKGILSTYGDDVVELCNYPYLCTKPIRWPLLSTSRDIFSRTDKDC